MAHLTLLKRKSLEGCVSVMGLIEGELAIFLMDTCAVASIMNASMYEELKSRHPITLSPWSGPSLLSASNIPIIIHGMVKASVEIAGAKFNCSSL